MVATLVIALLISSLCGAFLIRYSHLHSRFSIDTNQGPQKFHKVATPRIGGIPIFLAWLFSLIFFSFKTHSFTYLLFVMVALPAFSFGLLEDFTKKIGPLPRLIASFVSAALGFYFLGGSFDRVDCLWLDILLKEYALLSFIITLIAVGGVAHAFNIIDGYNGLSGVVSILILLSLSYVAFKVSDIELVAICFALIGAILGFLVWNFPRGLIFAGDAGAYLMGFIIAEISILLVSRHSEVSPWFPLLIVIYPVFETLFSMYRRKFLQNRSVGYPDALHLHQMIYRRIVRWMVGSKNIEHSLERNSLTSPYLWILTLTSVLPGILFWDKTSVLIIFIFIFIFIYLWLYWRIVKFKTPQSIILKKS